LNFKLLLLQMLLLLLLVSCLEAAEALLVTARASGDHPQHVEAHGLAQGPAGKKQRQREKQQRADQIFNWSTL
jgi:hypothetical protein